MASSSVNSELNRSIRDSISPAGKATLKVSKQVVNKSKKRITASKRVDMPFHETLQY